MRRFSLLLVLLLALPAQAQQPSFLARAYPARVGVGEGFVVEVTLSLEDGRVEGYTKPDFRGARVVSEQPSQSTQIQMGGGGSSVQTVYSWHYQLEAQQKGALELRRGPGEGERPRAAHRQRRHHRRRLAHRRAPAPAAAARGLALRGAALLARAGAVRRRRPQLHPGGAQQEQGLRRRADHRRVVLLPRRAARTSTSPSPSRAPTGSGPRSCRWPTPGACSWSPRPTRGASIWWRRCCAGAVPPAAGAPHRHPHGVGDLAGRLLRLDPAHPADQGRAAGDRGPAPAHGGAAARLRSGGGGALHHGRQGRSRQGRRWATPSP